MSDAFHNNGDEALARDLGVTLIDAPVNQAEQDEVDLSAPADGIQETCERYQILGAREALILFAMKVRDLPDSKANVQARCNIALLALAEAETYKMPTRGGGS